MPTTSSARAVVSEGFQELALALGGVAATYDLPDEAIWDLARAIDITHQRVRARLERTVAVDGLDELPESGCGHPAVAHLLQRLQAGASRVGGMHDGD